jgi:hypothetical protein
VLRINASLFSLLIAFIKEVNVYSSLVKPVSSPVLISVESVVLSFVGVTFSLYGGKRSLSGTKKFDVLSLILSISYHVYCE